MLEGFLKALGLQIGLLQSLNRKSCVSIDTHTHTYMCTCVCLYVYVHLRNCKAEETEGKKQDVALSVRSVQ